jgi:hypothetical protein
MRITKNAVVGNYAEEKVAINEVISAVVGSEHHGRLPSDSVAHQSHIFGRNGNWDIAAIFNSNPTIGNRRMPDVAAFDGNNEVSGITAKSAFEIDHNTTALLGFAQNVRASGFVESGFDQPNTNGAKAHSKQGGNAHDLRPPSGHALGSQVIFLAISFALGVASLFYANYLGSRGRADPYYYIFGVLAVYLSLVCSFLLQ